MKPRALGWLRGQPGARWGIPADLEAEDFHQEAVGFRPPLAGRRRQDHGDAEQDLEVAERNPRNH